MGNADYTVVVQVPIPFLTIPSISIGGIIGVLADFTGLQVPQAILWLQTNATALFQRVIDDATDLITAIPEATVTIQVKVGPTVIFNVKLIAQQTPVTVALPSFKLDLPNLAVDLSLSGALKVPFISSPIVIAVPIPVPVVQPVQILGISGGKVSASASAGVTTVPTPISNPISLPRI